MASEDDARRDDSGRSGARDRGESEFGPPVSGFGPPLNEFGPPLNDFGPPTGESPAVGWSPGDAPERPNLGWQPADGPPAPPAPPVPPPPPQYRAPDSSTAEASRAPAPDTRRMPAPEAPSAPETRRPPGPEASRTPAPETRRMSAPDTRGGPGPEPSRPVQGGPPPPQRPADPRPARESSGSLWDDDDLAKKLVAARPTPQRESSSLWDDDDLAKKLGTPRPEPEDEPERPRRNMGVLIGGLAAAFVVIVAIAAVIVFTTRKSEPEGPGAAPAGPPAGEPLACPAVSDGKVVIGNGPGGTSSGPQAILGFEHAYFADRNAAKARTFAAPDANLEAPDLLQKIIESQVPQGTSYCVRIESAAPDRFLVDITVKHPDGNSPKYISTITTVNRDGQNLVYLIE
ncbi:hypothetical protein BJY24_003680 [Nocardia transvalensis]|uniref:DUF8176 domain-containing protein n=1 Tax=Nocardia transvalensis TaxID=37333 RepID=A0A7W9PFR6_9NOCA|nr:hypothetical protein [Nocardia transvalensis]MBB5914813.1 hypothetical protein [Nocardia transvalensis]